MELNIKSSAAAPNILVVDDDKDIVYLLEQAFKRDIDAGLFNFVFAFSAEEATEYLDALGETALILILSDINMPGKNGLLLLKEIKEAGSQTPVYLYTAYDDEDKRIMAKQFGADAYMLKPIDFPALRAAIIKLLDKK